MTERVDRPDPLTSEEGSWAQHMNYNSALVSDKRRLAATDSGDAEVCHKRQSQLEWLLIV